MCKPLSVKTIGSGLLAFGLALVANRVWALVANRVWALVKERLRKARRPVRRDQECWKLIPSVEQYRGYGDPKKHAPIPTLKHEVAQRLFQLLIKGCQTQNAGVIWYCLTQAFPEFKAVSDCLWLCSGWDVTSGFVDQYPNKTYRLRFERRYFKNEVFDVWVDYEEDDNKKIYNCHLSVHCIGYKCIKEHQDFYLHHPNDPAIHTVAFEVLQRMVPMYNKYSRTKQQMFDVLKEGCETENSGLLIHCLAECFPYLDPLSRNFYKKCVHVHWDKPRDETEIRYKTWPPEKHSISDDKEKKVHTLRIQNADGWTNLTVYVRLAYKTDDTLMHLEVHITDDILKKDFKNLELRYSKADESVFQNLMINALEWV